MDRRGRHLQATGVAGGAQLLIAAQAENLALELAPGPRWGAVRTAGAIQPPLAVGVGVGATPPLVDGVPATHSLGGSTNRWISLSATSVGTTPSVAVGDLVVRLGVRRVGVWGGTIRVDGAGPAAG